MKRNELWAVPLKRVKRIYRQVVVKFRSGEVWKLDHYLSSQVRRGR